MIKSKELKLDEIRKIQLEIMDYVDSICKKYNLKYSLAGGTLLGAIRHKGYIPWDDDIDIIMMRNDYEKLIKVLKNNDNRFLLFEHRFNNKYYYPFMKIVDKTTTLVENKLKPIPNYGVYIDIFPVDNVPNSFIFRNIFVKKIERMRKLFYRKLINDYSKEILFDKKGKINFVKKIYIFFENLLANRYSCDKWINVIKKMALKFNNHNTNYAGVIVNGYYGGKEIMPKYVFSELEERMFENKTYYCIKNYDIYLSKLYGDYMKLPPIEKQISVHDFKAFLKEDK